MRLKATYAYLTVKFMCRLRCRPHATHVSYTTVYNHFDLWLAEKNDEKYALHTKNLADYFKKF